MKSHDHERIGPETETLLEADGDKFVGAPDNSTAVPTHTESPTTTEDEDAIDILVACLLMERFGGL